MKRMNYERIHDKIHKNDVVDSEIIQETKIPGFDINWSDDSGWTLLMNAVRRNRKELVRYLLMNPNIDVKHRSNRGNIVLRYCDHVSILKLLLNRKDLYVNKQDEWGDTRLHQVCFEGSEAYVKELLLDARINTSIRNKYRETALDIALRHKYYGIVKIIGNSRHTTLLRIPNNLLLYDIVRMIIEEY